MTLRQSTLLIWRPQLAQVISWVSPHFLLEYDMKVACWKEMIDPCDSPKIDRFEEPCMPLLGVYNYECLIRGGMHWFFCEYK